MKVEHLEVLLEEPSMEAALNLLLPKMIPSVTFTLHAHQGKAHLIGSLPAKLKGYAGWLPPTYRILVVIDRDDDDCALLKADLERHALNAGLVTKSTCHGRPYAVVNRLAVEELEAWYFGDWQAVRISSRARDHTLEREVPSARRHCRRNLGGL